MAGNLFLQSDSLWLSASWNRSLDNRSRLLARNITGQTCLWLVLTKFLLSSQNSFHLPAVHHFQNSLWLIQAWYSCYFNLISTEKSTNFIFNGLESQSRPCPYGVGQPLYSIKLSYICEEEPNIMPVTTWINIKTYKIDNKQVLVLKCILKTMTSNQSETNSEFLP